MEKLRGDYIAGFVDGEGCFNIKFIRSLRHDRKNKPQYFYWSVGFSIVLRDDDKDILECIKATLDCGKICFTKKQVRYYVDSIEDLEGKVKPFFEKYSLRAKKRFDFDLWKEALEILVRNKQDKNKRVVGHLGFTKIDWRASMKT